MSRESVDLVQAIYEGWARGDFTVGLSALERNVTLVIDDGIPDGGVFVGLDGVRNYMRRFLDSWESLTIAADSIQDVGDSVLVSVRQEGVGRASGLPTGQTYFQAWTFRGGKVIRLETILREDAALEAVGLSD
jgi:ketosteroid isomerase-like protein